MRNAQVKIVERDVLRELLAQERAKGRKIVFTNGCFDVLHVGHVRYLEGSKQEGDVLVVAVNSDSSTKGLKGPGRPILPQEARAGLVAGLRAVDFVLTFDEPNVENLLELLRPDVHAKGPDYTEESVPERATADRLGIRVVIVNGHKIHSTSGLIDTVRRSKHD